MKSFPSKLLFLLPCFLVLFSGSLRAQGTPVETGSEEIEAAVPAQNPQEFNLILNGRRITVGQDETRPVRPFMPATGEPLEIRPSPYLAPETFALQVQEETLPDTLPEPQSTRQRGELAERQRSIFEESELEALDPTAVGLLMPREGGFPVNLWEGSSAGRIIALLQNLPAGTSSPAANEMTRRLLLTAAPYPLDQQGNFSIEDFLYYRLERLSALGDLDALLRLYEQIPRENRDVRIKRLLVDGYLLDGDIESACNLADQGQRTEGSAYWLRINAICLALDGEERRARFNLSLLEEEGAAGFTFLNLFEDVVDLVAEENRNPAQAQNSPAEEEEESSFFASDFYLLSDLTPVHVGLLKLLTRDVEIDVTSGNPSNLLLTSLSRWQGLSLETKLKVADLAIERGILEQEFLRDLVSAYTFTAEEKESAHLLDYESWGVKGDALFYALAKEAPTPGQKIQHVREGWERARVGGRAPFIARLYYDAISDIPPRRGFLEFAPVAASISLLSGQIETARGWYDMVRSAAASASDPEATRMLVEMWPLMVVMDTRNDIPYSPEILRLWRQSLSLLSPEEQVSRALLFYRVLEVLGHNVPDSLKSEVFLARDSQEGASLLADSLGETILSALIAFDRDGPSSVRPVVLANIIDALQARRQDEYARRLALETLLAHSF